MLGPAWHDDHFARAQVLHTTPQFNAHLAEDDQEQLICLSMAVPSEVTQNFDKSDLIAVIATDDPRIPMVGELAECLFEIDYLHCP
jgi:hypothetical protein